MSADGDFEPGSLRLVGFLRRAVILLLVLGAAAFLIDGANRPANPTLLPPNGRVAEAGLAAFGAALLSVDPGPGLSAPARPVCVLVARTPAQQEQGLKGQPSLGHFGGMLFVYPGQTTAVFDETGTVVGLSIAWFDAGGTYIAALDSTPCPVGQLCPTYSAGRPYTYALEVPSGGLGSLGIGPGSSVHVAGPCSG